MSVRLKEYNTSGEQNAIYEEKEVNVKKRRILPFIQQVKDMLFMRISGVAPVLFQKLFSPSVRR